MGHRTHPRPDVLLRFLRGEATRAERRAVVRHLLTGCRECVAVTRPVWKLADEELQPCSGTRKGGDEVWTELRPVGGAPGR